MNTYTTTYVAKATVTSQATMATAFGAIARDTTTENLLGLTLVSDIVTQNADNIRVQRQIIYTGNNTGPIPDPQTGDVLRNFYTELFNQKLSQRPQFSMTVI